LTDLASATRAGGVGANAADRTWIGGTVQHGSEWFLTGRTSARWCRSRWSAAWPLQTGSRRAFRAMPGPKRVRVRRRHARAPPPSSGKRGPQKRLAW